jgi:Leucine rich repeat
MVKIIHCLLFLIFLDYSSSAMYNVTTGSFLCDMTVSMPGVLALNVPWSCPTATQIAAKTWCTPWSGVLCSATKNIISIDLNLKRLQGFMPNSFGKLSTLKYLYLQNNFISGTIPPSIGNLSSLLGLRLDNNLLEGTVPKSLTKLRRLTVLNLNANYLTGSLPSGFAEQTYNDDASETPSSFNKLSHYPTSQPTSRPSGQPTSQPSKHQIA